MFCILADEELAGAVRYYAAIDPGLGVRFYLEIQRLIQEVCTTENGFAALTRQPDFVSSALRPISKRIRFIQINNRRFFERASTDVIQQISLDGLPTLQQKYAIPQPQPIGLGSRSLFVAIRHLTAGSRQKVTKPGNSESHEVLIEFVHREPPASQVPLKCADPFRG